LAVEALHHGPESLIDPLLPLGTLHVDAILHCEHIRRVHPPFQPPLGDDVVYLQGVEELDHIPGLELVVRGEEFSLDALSQHPGQKLLDQLLLVHVERALRATQRKAF